MNCIVKLTNNDSWYFYHDESNGICFSRLNSHGELQESGILSGDSPDDFDVICDDKNNIHLCCQNKTGDIVYFRYKSNVWDRTVLLKSKSNTTNKKQFHMYSINGWINIMYILEYRGKNMLTHHIPERNNGEPEVVDYIGRSYTSTVDKSGNIYVYYDSEINSAFGYKTYQWSQKRWSEFTSTPNYDNCDTLLAMFDNDNSASVISERNKEIHFIRNNNDTIISTGEKPIMLSVNNSCIAQWIYHGRLHSAISVNGGNFNKSGEYPVNKRTIPELYRISYFNNEISAEYCYGYRSGDRIILFELNDLCFGNDSQNEPVPEIKATKPEIKEYNQEKNSYNNSINKLILLMNSAVEALTSIERRVSSYEDTLSSIEGIIKELQQGSSRKRKL